MQIYGREKGTIPTWRYRVYTPFIEYLYWVMRGMLAQKAAQHKVHENAVLPRLRIRPPERSAKDGRCWRARKRDMKTRGEEGMQI
jgi:hypothetical protein